MPVSCFQPKTVNLDISAKILIGNPNVDRTENGKFKSKFHIQIILPVRPINVTEYGRVFIASSIA